MLTKRQYIELWLKDFRSIGIKYTDSYSDYLDRECYFQDYLDLFRGVNTRFPNTVYTRIFDCPNSHTYLKDPTDEHNNNPAKCLLNILRDDIKDNINNKSELGKSLQKDGFPKIKYVLIAEAPAKQVKKIADLKKKDQAKIGGKRYPNIINFNTYFYDPNQLKPTHYFSAPYKALVNKTSNHTSDIEKKIELIEYAIEGALLLDLFPFAIKYDSNLRNNIVSGEIHFNFWENRANSYSIKNRTDNLSSILSDELIGCFIGPPAIFVDLSSRLYYSLYKSRNKMKFNWREAEFACIGQNRSNNPDKTRIEEALGFL